MTTKLSHIIGLNKSINTATNNGNSQKRRRHDGGGSSSGNNGGGGSGGVTEKQPLWKTNPYKEKIEGKFYPEKLYNRFSPEQKAQHYELGGEKGKAGLKNRSVQPATSSNSDTESAGESGGKNARKRQK